MRYWNENLSSLLAVGQWLPSVSCHIGLSKMAAHNITTYFINHSYVKNQEAQRVCQQGRSHSPSKSNLGKDTPSLAMLHGYNQVTGPACTWGECLQERMTIRKWRSLGTFRKADNATNRMPQFPCLSQLSRAAHLFFRTLVEAEEYQSLYSTERVQILPLSSHVGLMASSGSSPKKPRFPQAPLAILRPAMSLFSSAEHTVFCSVQVALWT